MGLACVKGVENPLSLVHNMAYTQTLERAVAQLGSALPWGGRGRRFKSCRSDQSRVLLVGSGIELFSGVVLSVP